MRIRVAVARDRPSVRNVWLCLVLRIQGSRWDMGQFSSHERRRVASTVRSYPKTSISGETRVRLVILNVDDATRRMRRRGRAIEQRPQRTAVIDDQRITESAEESAAMVTTMKGKEKPARPARRCAPQAGSISASSAANHRARQQRQNAQRADLDRDDHNIDFVKLTPCRRATLLSPHTECTRPPPQISTALCHEHRPVPHGSLLMPPTFLQLLISMAFDAFSTLISSYPKLRLAVGRSG